MVRKCPQTLKNSVLWGIRIVHFRIMANVVPLSLCCEQRSRCILYRFSNLNIIVAEMSAKDYDEFTWGFGKFNQVWLSSSIDLPKFYILWCLYLRFVCNQTPSLWYDKMWQDGKKSFSLQRVLRILGPLPPAGVHVSAAAELLSKAARGGLSKHCGLQKAQQQTSIKESVAQEETIRPQQSLAWLIQKKGEGFPLWGFPNAGIGHLT